MTPLQVGKFIDTNLYAAIFRHSEIYLGQVHQLQKTIALSYLFSAHNWVKISFTLTP